MLVSDDQHYLDELLKPYRRFAEKEQKKIDSKMLAAAATGKLSTSLKKQTDGLLLPPNDKSN